jgi:CRISPR/Cas system-associated exonuclease Cas4 (RecB family)
MIKISRSLKISPSFYEMFQKCSMQYKWNVLDEIQPDPGSDNLYAVLGSSFHKSMEIQDKFDVETKDLKQYWRGIFLSHLADAQNLKKNVSYQEFLSKGYDLIKSAVNLKKRWTSKSEIVALEKYFRIEYKNEYIENTFISGKIDLIVKSKDGVFTVIDWKTSKNKDKDIEKNNQLTFYIYFINKYFKIPLDKIWCALVYPQADDMIFSQRTQADIDALFIRIDDMLRRIAEDDFKKEPKLNSKKGDCFFCSYKLACEKL